MPMTPQYALKEFGHKLSTFEHKEVMEYPEVWFLGMDSKKVEGVAGAAQNSGNCKSTPGCTDKGMEQFYLSEVIFSHRL